MKKVIREDTIEPHLDDWNEVNCQAHLARGAVVPLFAEFFSIKTLLFL